MANPQGPQPSPVLIFETINAFQRSAAMKAAIDLDLFTAIQEGNKTATDVAKRTSSSERGIRILLDYLVVHGFLEKEKGAYSLTQDSAFFLVRTSPAYAGDTIEFLQSPLVREAFADLTTTVKRGTTLLGGEGTVSHENPVWVRFAKAMAQMSFPAAQQIAAMAQAAQKGPIRVLDIAAGHGIYGIAFAMANPQAHIFAVDWPEVLQVARENANRFGVGQRHHQIPGSAFEKDLGEDYDLALVTNFLHHFDPPTCEKLLRRIHRSLKPGATVWTVEFVPNPDRVTPHVPAAFSLIMLATTGSGDAYTYSELESMFRNAGYSSVRHQALEMSFQSLVIAQK